MMHAFRLQTLLALGVIVLLHTTSLGASPLDTLFVPHLDEQARSTDASIFRHPQATILKGESLFSVRDNAGASIDGSSSAASGDDLLLSDGFFRRAEEMPQSFFDGGESIPYSTYDFDEPLTVPHKLLVTDFRELDALHLRGMDTVSNGFLERMMRLIAEGLAMNNYLFIFSRPFEPIPQPHEINILAHEGLKLESVMRTSKDIGQCSSITDTDASARVFGADLGTLTSGVCGQIATLHSLAKLHLLRPERIFSGDNFSEDAIAGVTPRDQQSPSGMTMAEIARMHEYYGTGQCVYAGTQCAPLYHVTMQQETYDRLARKFEHQLSNFNDRLRDFMRSTAPRYDCTLAMTSFDVDARGNVNPQKIKITHAEHVVALHDLQDGDKLVITTQNGFQQGNQSTQVPREAGTNTIDIDLTVPACTLERSTDAKTNTAVGGEEIHFIEFTCCAAP